MPSTYEGNFSDIKAAGLYKTINEHKLKTKLSTIIWGSHKQLFSVGLKPFAICASVRNCFNNKAYCSLHFFSTGHYNVSQVD